MTDEERAADEGVGAGREAADESGDESETPGEATAAATATAAETATVLSILRENARTSVADLARQTGLDEATVETVIEELEAADVIRGYRAVVDWDAADAERVRAAVELDVELDRETGYGDVAERIARFPEVEALRLVSGDYDLLVEVEGDSMSEVSSFVGERVARLPAVTNTVTHYVMDTYAEAGILFGDGDDDDRRSVTP
ncbi:Lrp/AsnC family transcriptional regulator [Halobaculum sp. MBLA0147]|uniref:Lrp/AsnC family transcriptional regulator n=1 Tax=Halobaculum sp. MBLA0147 TaxID=3079934 RepID=UPI0035250FD1